jgi:hypothetical protein
MKHILKIEIYKILKEEFVTPLAEAPVDLTANYHKNDIIIIIGEEAWVTNRNLETDETDDIYSLAVYSPEFVRINPWLFKKVK